MVQFLPQTFLLPSLALISSQAKLSELDWTSDFFHNLFGRRNLYLHEILDKAKHIKEIKRLLLCWGREWKSPL